MYFDKFDICEAYYIYMMLYHAGGVTNRDFPRLELKPTRNISYQLHNIGFRISPMIYDESDLTDNGREIFNALVDKWEH